MQLSASSTPKCKFSKPCHSWRTTYTKKHLPLPFPPCRFRWYSILCIQNLDWNPLSPDQARWQGWWAGKTFFRWKQAGCGSKGPGFCDWGWWTSCYYWSFGEASLWWELDPRSPHQPSQGKACAKHRQEGQGRGIIANQHNMYVILSGCGVYDWRMHGQGGT